MQRVLSVYLPNWSVERFVRRHRPPRGKQVLLVSALGGREVVARSSPEARRAGACPGLTLAEARALVSHAPIVAPHMPEEDAAGLAALARYVSGRWSPTVSADQPDGLLCDIAGCEHLFGSERGLVRSLVHALAKLGFAARTAVARTVGAAWAMARFAESAHTTVRGGEEREALASLPVDGLRIPARIVESLREVGVETIAQVLSLPRSTLPARFGPDLLLRIDQALGVAFEPVSRVAEDEPIVASLDLPGGTTHIESIESAVYTTLVGVCRELERRESGLRRLRALFTRLDARDIEVVVQVSKPARSPEHLWLLVRPKIERLHLGYGVEHITLRAELVTRVSHEQALMNSARAGTSADDSVFAAMVDTIGNRIGVERVLCAVMTESYRPERAFGLVRYGRGIAGGSRSVLDRPRPTRLLPQPEPIDVIALSPDGPVMQVITSLGSGAGRRVITCSIGPERLGGEWWRCREGARDYFRVQDDQGVWLWIFRDVCSGSWFIHGAWA